jgi:hypothetical protein
MARGPAPRPDRRPERGRYEAANEHGNRGILLSSGFPGHVARSLSGWLLARRIHCEQCHIADLHDPHDRLALPTCQRPLRDTCDIVLPGEWID